MVWFGFTKATLKEGGSSYPCMQYVDRFLELYSPKQREIIAPIKELTGVKSTIASESFLTGLSSLLHAEYSNAIAIK